VRAASLLLALALVVAACGDDDAATATTETEAPIRVSTGDQSVGAEVTDGAADGDLVSVHYRGTLDDGSEFDSSEGREPLQFIVGSGQVITGFDEAVRGLVQGDEVTVRMEPGQAYGEVDPELIIVLPLEGAPEGLTAGEQVQLTSGLATVLEIDTDAGTVTLDTNHALAGEALTFEIEVVSITR